MCMANRLSFLRRLSVLKRNNFSTELDNNNELLWYYEADFTADTRTKKKKNKNGNGHMPKTGVLYVIYNNPIHSLVIDQLQNYARAKLNEQRIWNGVRASFLLHFICSVKWKYFCAGIHSHLRPNYAAAEIDRKAIHHTQRTKHSHPFQLSTTTEIPKNFVSPIFSHFSHHIMPSNANQSKKQAKEKKIDVFQVVFKWHKSKFVLRRKLYFLNSVVHTVVGIEPSINLSIHAIILT